MQQLDFFPTPPAPGLSQRPQAASKPALRRDYRTKEDFFAEDYFVGYLREAMQDYPTWPDMLDILGEIYDASGKPEEAVRYMCLLVCPVIQLQNTIREQRREALTRYRRRGLRCYKIGRDPLYLTADLVEFIKQHPHEVEAAGDLETPDDDSEAD